MNFNCYRNQITCLLRQLPVVRFRRVSGAPLGEFERPVLESRTVIFALGPQ